MTARRPLLPARDTAAALAAWRQALDMARLTDDDDVDSELLRGLVRASYDLEWAIVVRGRM